MLTLSQEFTKVKANTNPCMDHIDQKKRWVFRNGCFKVSTKTLDRLSLFNTIRINMITRGRVADIQGCQGLRK